MSNNNDRQTEESGEPPTEITYVLRDLLRLSEDSTMERYVRQYHIRNVNELLDKTYTELFDSPVTPRDGSTTYSDWIHVNTIEALQHVKAFRNYRTRAGQTIGDWTKISQSDLNRFTTNVRVTLDVVTTKEDDTAQSTVARIDTHEASNQPNLVSPEPNHVQVDTTPIQPIPMPDDEDTDDDDDDLPILLPREVSDDDSDTTIPPLVGIGRSESPNTVMADLENDDDEPPPLLDPLTGRLIYDGDDEAARPQVHQIDRDTANSIERAPDLFIDRGANGSVFAPTVPLEHVTADLLPSSDGSFVYYCDDVIYYAPGARERVPTSYEEAMGLDTQNGDTAWEDAMLDELESLVGTFTSLPGQRVFRDFMNGELRFHFYIKWNGVRCAQLLDGQPDRPLQELEHDGTNNARFDDTPDDPPVTPYLGETPTSFDHALLLDSKSGNHLWRDAILHELHENASPEASIGYLQGHYDLSFSITKDHRCLATLTPNGTSPTLPTHDSSASSFIRQLPPASSDGECFDEPVLNTTERSAWDTPPRMKERATKPTGADTELIIQTGSQDTVSYVCIDSSEKNGEPNHRKFMTLRMPSTYEEALQIDKECGDPFWQEAIDRGGKDGCDNGLPTKSPGKEYIDILERWYQQTFHQKPPYIVNWEVFAAAKQVTFNEFSTTEQQCKYRELLSHLQKVTYLGHLDFANAIAVLDTKDGWKEPTNVRSIKMLARLLITFSRAAMMSDTDNDKHTQMTPTEERRLMRINQSARLINHVVWHNTNGISTMEEWIKWGEYTMRHDLFSTEKEGNNQHGY